MITIDYALRIYTDALNSNQSIDLGYFRDNLSVDEFIEFQELIPFICLFKSVKVTEKFEEVFDKVHKRKVEIYDNLPSVVNFKADKNSVNEETKKKVDAMFDEEFKDD